jgi:hypothetical protein
VRLTALITIMLSAATPHAHATDEVFERQGFLQAVEDAELDTFRGKWAGPSGFQSIGIDLRSVWQTPNGAQLQAGVSIDIDAQSVARGDARVTTQASVVPGSGAVTPANTGGARLISGSDPSRSTTGLVQLLQLAGDRNAANNRLLFDVVKGSSGSVANLSEDAATASNASSTASASGMNASARAGAGGLSIELEVPGVGTLTQRMGRSLEAPGMKQSIRVAGDDQVLQNIATLRLTLAPTTARSLAIDNVVRSLGSTVGLRR